MGETCKEPVVVTNTSIASTANAKITVTYVQDMADRPRHPNPNAPIPTYNSDYIEVTFYLPEILNINDFYGMQKTMFTLGRVFGVLCPPLNIIFDGGVIWTLWATSLDDTVYMRNKTCFTGDATGSPRGPMTACQKFISKHILMNHKVECQAQQQR